MIRFGIGVGVVVAVVALAAVASYLGPWTQPDDASETLARPGEFSSPQPSPAASASQPPPTVAPTPSPDATATQPSPTAAQTPPPDATATQPSPTAAQTPEPDAGEAYATPQAAPVGAGFLGVALMDAASGGGAVIVGLLDGAPSAGRLAEGQIIVSINGDPVASAADVVTSIAASAPGDIAILALHDGSEASVRLGERPESSPPLAAWPRLGGGTPGWATPAPGEARGPRTGAWGADGTAFDALDALAPLLDAVLGGGMSFTFADDSVTVRAAWGAMVAVDADARSLAVAPSDGSAPRAYAISDAAIIIPGGAPGDLSRLVIGASALVVDVDGEAAFVMQLDSIAYVIDGLSGAWMGGADAVPADDERFGALLDLVFGLDGADDCDAVLRMLSALGILPSDALEADDGRRDAACALFTTMFGAGMPPAGGAPWGTAVSVSSCEALDEPAFRELAEALDGLLAGLSGGGAPPSGAAIDAEALETFFEMALGACEGEEEE